MWFGILNLRGQSRQYEWCCPGISSDIISENFRGKDLLDFRIKNIRKGLWSLLLYINQPSYPHMDFNREQSFN